MNCSFCPDGFVLGSLKPHHIPHVLIYYDYYRGWPNELFFVKSSISNFISVALFHVDNLDYPVAWSFQLPCGRMSGLYSLEIFRKNNLGSFVAVEMARATAAEGFVPWTVLQVGNTVMRKMNTKNGGFETNYTVKALMLE